MCTRQMTKEDVSSTFSSRFPQVDSRDIRFSLQSIKKLILACWPFHVCAATVNGQVRDYVVVAPDAPLRLLPVSR